MCKAIVLTDHERAVLSELRRREVAKQVPPFDSAWDFIGRACITKDEETGNITPFPAFEVWPETGELRFGYLKYIAEHWQDHPIIAIDKCRRMMITWLFLCLYLYDTLTQRNHANFVGSKKLEDAAYLLGPERVLGVYNRIPAEVWPNKPDLIPGAKQGQGVALLTCPQTGSYMRALASGAEQMRGYTATNVFLDEFAFWDWPAASWRAIRPTANNGHIHMVSTANLGAYMHELITDKVG